MHKHHIIPRHEWKKRFGNLKGFNASDNVVYLTPEQHAHVHYLLYEINGFEGDRIAARSLEGTIGKEELQKELSFLGGKTGGRPKGFHHTNEWKNENSLRMMGNKHLLGFSPSKKQRELSAKRMSGNTYNLGNIHSEKSKLQISISLRNAPRLTCPHCKLTGGPANLKRYHFDNCKRK